MFNSTSDIPHSWLFPESLATAAEIQRDLAAKVITQDDFVNNNFIAGMDVSNNPYDATQTIFASAVLLTADGKQIIKTANVKQKAQFPYVPGFLGFREAPALVEACYQLPQKPAIIFVDGHGISHPRGLGIASHIGVLLDVAAIGVAKSLLVGKPAAELGTQVGAQVPVIWHGKIIAILLRSKLRCNPLIISAGHRISLETAVKLVQQYLHGYRLPEPTRQAHLAANVFRKQNI